MPGLELWNVLMGSLCWDFFHPSQEILVLWWPYIIGSYHPLPATGTRPTNTCLSLIDG